MKYLTTILAVLVVACYTTTRSPLLRESALVVETVYQPSQHGTGVGYAVVFRCQHGKFVVEGEGGKYRALWEKLAEGDSVTVLYHEVYREHDDGRRELVDHDFIDAVKGR